MLFFEYDFWDKALELSQFTIVSFFTIVKQRLDRGGFQFTWSIIITIDDFEPAIKNNFLRLEWEITKEWGEIWAF